MHTPIKYALGLLGIALVALAPTVTVADYSPSAIGHHTIGDGMYDPVNFNACDYNDASSTTIAQLPNYNNNNFPYTLYRAGDQGIFNSCVYIVPGAYDPANGLYGEQGMPYNIVANGYQPLGSDDCEYDFPDGTYSCGIYTHHAAELGLFACFYDAGGNFIECQDTYDQYLHDLVGVVPTDAAAMLVGSAPGTAKVTWWFGPSVYGY